MDEIRLVGGVARGSLANSEPVENSEQPGRDHNWEGIVNILFSCLSTLSLAVYTALNLNINPSH
jgi:hypothetical protein